MDDISKNIKKILLVFLIFFLALFSYLTYFEIFTGPKVVTSQYNRRLWAIRNEVLRGTIYDRNLIPLTKSERVNSESQKRTYTANELCAHVLGYIDIRYGITGLEKKYDSELMHANNNNILDLIMKKTNGGKVGRSLRTTLDLNIQKKAYDLLGNNKGAVVALNPKTGEILALVSKPSFNPNTLNETWAALNKDSSSPLINRAVSGLYPPGSTFKTITAISALENINGIMNRRIDDNGRLYFNSKDYLSNFNGEVLGNIDFKQAYYESSNVYFGTIGMELGNDNLKNTAEKFFFNKDLPVDGIAAEASRFPSIKKYEKGNIAQSAIGQSSILATPLEMAAIAETIANNGIMMKPFLVKDIMNPNGEVISKISPVSLGNIITGKNAKTMQDLMRAVVTSGTGSAAEIQGIPVCGKTGTADHKDQYSKNEQPHAWFIGFAPYNDPQIAVAVIVENGGQGGIVAAGIARDVISAALVK